MRKTMMALAAVMAATAAGVVSANACDIYGPCRGAYANSVTWFDHAPPAPEPAPPGPAEPIYYYVNQGPAFTGPGVYAPVPTYQERAVTGWHGYDYGYYYGYNGGPYGDATSHYYDGMPPAYGPVVYRYGPWHGHRHVRHYNMRYGHGPVDRSYASTAHNGGGARVIRVPRD